MFPDRLETDRLRFEALPSDRADLFDLYPIFATDPAIEEITEYLTWDPHELPIDTQEFLDHAEELRETDEGCEFVVRVRDSEEIAGTTGVYVNWDRQLATLGLWLRKRFWGRGYSGERADAMLELAFDRLDLDLVVAEHLDGNERSKRAIEKYVERHGGHKEGVFRNQAVVDGEPRDTHRYSIAREEWEVSADG